MYLYVVLALVALAVVVNAGWRFASRYRSLPCPSLLAPFFEGSLVDLIAGTSQTLEQLQLAPGQTILEVGPGPGRLLIPAARRVQPGGQAVGIDIQAKMIDRLKRRAADAGLSNLRAQVGDATALELDDASFDLVYLCTVLGEVPDRAAALAECRRVLKPGGILAIIEILFDPHYQRQAKVDELARAAGFEPVTLAGNWRSYTATFRKP